MQRLEINKLEKSFGKHKVLKEMNLQIEPGIFGLLGPNGAGKTTLMKCVLGLYPYKGSIRLHKDNTEMTSYVQGYLPQFFNALKDLKVRNAMEYISTLKKIRDPEEIHRCLDLVGINDKEYLDKKIKNLSGGMRRRVGIAQALLGKPDVLVIDEPTSGLDPQERVRFRNILTKLPKDIITIISTHIIEDVMIVADNIAMIQQGRIVKTGSVANIIESVQGKVGEMEVMVSQLEKIKEKYIISREEIRGERIYLRIIDDVLPTEAKSTDANLEDAYFYYMKQV